MSGHVAVKIEYEKAIKELCAGIDLAQKEGIKILRRALNKTAVYFQREIFKILLSGQIIPSPGERQKFITALRGRRRITMRVSKAGRKDKNEAVIWLGTDALSSGYYDNIREDKPWTGTWIGQGSGGRFFPKSFIVPGKYSGKPLIATALPGRRLSIEEVPFRKNTPVLINRMQGMIDRYFYSAISKEVDNYYQKYAKSA